jgi:hypothetical protein
MKHIEVAIKKLEARHKGHIAVYCKDNTMRLTGWHETGSIDEFTYGVANRGCSICTRSPASRWRRPLASIKSDFSTRCVRGVTFYLGSGRVCK